jgi:Enoyl-CoA hydratase/isomerase
MTATRLERDGGLAVLTLDNPPLNQISEQVVDDLADAITALEAADDVRALLVRGTGDVFSAGADVKLFAGRSAAEMRPLIERFLDFGRRVEALPFPTLAAVHGMCVAGGLELVLFLDLIWAAEGTNLGLLETRIGIVPLAGGIERVAARAGLGRARSIALSGNLFRPRSSPSAWPKGRRERSPPSSSSPPPTRKAASPPPTSACSKTPSASSTPMTRAMGSSRSSRGARQRSPAVDPLRVCVRAGLSPLGAGFPRHSRHGVGGGG